MRRFVLTIHSSFLGGLAAIVVMFLLGATSVRNTVPSFTSPPSNWGSLTETHLLNELPYALSTRSSGYIVSGGTAPTGAGPTHQITAVEARVFGYYVSQVATTSPDYTNSRRYFLYVHQDTSTPASFTVSGGTGCTWSQRMTNLLFVECATGSGEPDKPANSLPLMAVTVGAGGSIDAVVDLRPMQDTPLPSLDQFTSLANAITTLGSTDTRTLFVSRRTIIGANVTVTNNIKLVCRDRGLLDVNTGITVTIQGDFEAGLRRCFIANNNASSGAIAFGNGSIATRNVVWWGALGQGGVNDYTAEFQAALNSVGSNGARVFVPCGSYPTATGWTISNRRTTLKGEGFCSSLFMSATGTLLAIDPGTGTIQNNPPFNTVVEDLSITSSILAGITGINIQDVSEIDIHRNYFEGPSIGIQIAGGAGVNPGVFRAHIRRNTIRGAATAGIRNISPSNANAIVVENNSIVDSGGFCITTSTTAGQVRGWLIQGNDLECSSGGIYLRNGVQSTVIQNNWLEMSNVGAIILETAAGTDITSTVIQGNEISCGGVCTAVGISLQPGRTINGVDISGNQIQGWATGIRLIIGTGSTDNLKLGPNNFSAVTTPVNLPTGLLALTDLGIGAVNYLNTTLRTPRFFNPAVATDLTVANTATATLIPANALNTGATLFLITNTTSFASGLYFISGPAATITRITGSAEFTTNSPCGGAESCVRVSAGTVVVENQTGISRDYRVVALGSR